MKKVYKVVKENVAKHLEYRKKEYLEDDARDFKEGGTVLIFMPQTKKGKAPKLTPGWSYPFKIIRKITPAVYELEALNWSQEPIRVIRGLSHLKLYQGETDFRDKTRRYEATDFQEAHDFDTEPESEEEEEERRGQRNTQQQPTQERIRLPSGDWIQRSFITGMDMRTDE